MVSLFVEYYGNWERIMSVSWVRKLNKTLTQLKNHINQQKGKKYKNVQCAGKKKRNEILRNLENETSSSDSEIVPTYPKIRMEKRTKLLDTMDKALFESFTVSSEKVKSIGFKGAVQFMEKMENVSKMPRHVKNSRKIRKIELIREWEKSQTRRKGMYRFLYFMSVLNMFD